MDKIAAVAAGDLSRRAPDNDGRCEVGRLAGSLNRILSQVEQSFNIRAESEATARRSTDRSCRIVADTASRLHRPIGVIQGFADYYRQRGRLGPGELDRMIRRVADEAAGRDALARDLLSTRHDEPRPLRADASTPQGRYLPGAVGGSAGRVTRLVEQRG